MRTIKFRGWAIYEKRWIIGDLVDTDPNDGPSIQYNDEEDGWMVDNVNEKSLGQFTGIIDVNGAEIFEGDIIEVTLKYDNNAVSTYKAVVDMKEGAFGFKNKQGFAPFYGQTHENFKVVGNIFDNPELLKGGKK